MALTPEDITNKRFKPTKLREGYDQDEVDDFLDEVTIDYRKLVIENERLITENAELRSRLEQMAAVAPAADEVQTAPFTSAPAPPVPESAPVPVVVPSTQQTDSANDLLQLAKRIHDEHVQEGLTKRNELIEEGRATSTRILDELKAKQAAEFESSQRVRSEAIAALEMQRIELQKRIEELRNYEADYRKRLREMIESQLRNLDEIPPTLSVEASGQ